MGNISIGEELRKIADVANVKTAEDIAEEVYSKILTNIRHQAMSGNYEFTLSEKEYPAVYGEGISNAVHRELIKILKAKANVDGLKFDKYGEGMFLDNPEYKVNW